MCHANAQVLGFRSKFYHCMHVVDMRKRITTTLLSKGPGGKVTLLLTLLSIANDFTWDCSVLTELRTSYLYAQLDADRKCTLSTLCKSWMYTCISIQIINRHFEHLQLDRCKSWLWTYNSVQIVYTHNTGTTVCLAYRRTCCLCFQKWCRAD